jgi:methyltransferase (TIGR00027 family)
VRRPSPSAQAVALARAHLHRAGVIDDPWAQRSLTPPRRLLAAALRTWPLRSYGRSPSFAFLAARTRFFDHAVTRALDQGVRQVVILGAGYDSRALRLARPAVQFFEVDHATTQADKQRRIPAGGATLVLADLMVERLDDALPAAGFTPDSAAVFIIEGLTMYLTEAANHTMFASLAGLAAPGSRLAANFSEAGGGSIAPASRAVAMAVRLRWALAGEPTRYWATTRKVPSMMRRTGWTLEEVITGPTLATRYNTADTMRATAVNPRMLCVTAHRTLTRTPSHDPP